MEPLLVTYRQQHSTMRRKNFSSLVNNIQIVSLLVKETVLKNKTTILCTMLERPESDI